MKKIFIPFLVVGAFIVSVSVYLVGLGIQQVLCDTEQNTQRYIACHEKIDAQINNVPKDPAKAKALLEDITNIQ